MAASLHWIRLSVPIQRARSRRYATSEYPELCLFWTACPLLGRFRVPRGDRINRAGLEYQGDFSERTWAHTTFGYRFENENGFVGDVNFGQTHGQRLNNDAYLQQQLTLGRLGIIAGGRFVHNSAFGSTGVPRIALTFQAPGTKSRGSKRPSTEFPRARIISRIRA